MATGITFHNNLGNDGLGTQQFRFTGVSVPGFAGATCIWRCKFSQQNGYYTTFFYDTNITTDYTSDRSYIGCHPYPLEGYRNNDAANGSTHNFEISCNGHDYCGTVAANDPSGPDEIDTGGFHTSALTDNTRWYTQALVISAVNSIPTAIFYWDLDNSLSKKIIHTFDGTFDAPAGGTSGLTWGASPWSGTTVSETMNGTLRGLQIYSFPFPVNVVSAEAANGSSNTPLTISGTTYLYYINQNPQPSDISDKSGLGHNPTWVGSSSGTLFSATDDITVTVGVISGSYSLPTPQLNYDWKITTVPVLSGTYSIYSPSIQAGGLMVTEISSVSRRLKF